ncbi:hypothetical protein [Alteromonas sp. AMM-1]|uniref:hypothetical protein n=1 Tax=Alteromonas sp. AMM-1 TaxID=3394233 RepID=UPI0039A41C84
MTTMVQTQERPKRSLLIIFAVFVLPVVLAKLALDGDWFERGATNRGELLQPVVSLTSVLENQPPSWRVMYIVPAACNAECENALYAIQQVWVALGKETDRAKPAVFITPSSDPMASAKLADYPHIQAMTVTAEQAASLNNTALVDHLFIVDTQANAMLRFPVYALRQDAIMGSRDVLADLRKLLKLSRIG